VLTLRSNSGGAIWGSAPALDAEHNTVYITTENNYDVRQSVNAATGDIRWSFQTPGASVGGPSVAGGTVFCGDGHHNFLGGPTHANVLYAFAAPGTSSQ
jgi:outer membrane protein assembly factor BamB